MLDHVIIQADDLGALGAFYDQVVAVLQGRRTMNAPALIGYGGHDGATQLYFSAATDAGGRQACATRRHWRWMPSRDPPVCPAACRRGRLVAVAVPAVTRHGDPHARRSRRSAKAADTIRDPCWQYPDLAWDARREYPSTPDMAVIPVVYLRCGAVSRAGNWMVHAAAEDRRFLFPALQ
jgi:hypothetical protein